MSAESHDPDHFDAEVLHTNESDPQEARPDGPSQKGSSLQTKQETEGKKLDGPLDATAGAQPPTGSTSLNKDRDLLAENATLRSRISDLEAELSELYEENAALARENENFSAGADAIPPDTLGELQKVIKELNENWKAAVGREKALASDMYLLKQECDSNKRKCATLKEELRKKEADLVKAASEVSQLLEDKQELATLKDECRRLTAENMKAQRYSREKSVENEKLQEDMYVLSQKVQHMRELVTASQSGKSGDKLEQTAEEKANCELVKQKYQKVKGKYKAVRDQLAMCNIRIKSFETALANVSQKQTSLSHLLQEALKKAEGNEVPSRERSLSALSETLQETATTVEGLFERLQSKTFFNAATAEEMRILSLEDEENRCKAEQEKEEISVRMLRVEAELKAAKTQLSGAETRLQQLDRVEKLVWRHFPRARDIVQILTQLLDAREEQTRASSKPVTPRRSPMSSIAEARRVSVNFSLAAQPAGKKVASLATSLQELEKTEETGTPKNKPKPSFSGIFKT